MANESKLVEGTWEVAESISLSSLTIADGASIVAPEGKYVTLTVDGTTHTIQPGSYEGDVKLTVSDNYTRKSLRFGEETISNFHAGVIVKDGKLLSDSSVAAAVTGGTITDSKADGVSIKSIEWDFNGFVLDGDTTYEIDNSEIELDGDGTDDFVGMGAGIAAVGDTKLTINNTKISNKGIGRGTLFVGGNADVTMNDCEFVAYAAEPTPEEMKAGQEAERMMEPPWSIGLKGNVRTLNLAEKGKLTLNNSHIVCNRWGALSIDGACLNRMYINDSLIEITGDNGYGFFCIADDIMFDYDSIDEPGCLNIASGSTFNVAYTAALMSLGNGCAEFKDASVVNSRRFGVFCHRHNGGYLKINSGSEFNTEKSSIVVKGSNLHIELDDAKFAPKNGTILQLMDNDDVGMCPDPFLVPIGEVDVRDDRDLTTAIEDEDIFVSIKNMTADGDFLNSTTNFYACNRRLPRPEGFVEPPTPPGAEKLRGFIGNTLMGAKNLDVQIEDATVNGTISAANAAYGEGITRIEHDTCDELSNITQTPAPAINNGVIVTVGKGGIWNVASTSYLTKLEIKDGGQVNGASMTVDGEAVELKEGIYTGQIVLTVA
jgi:hypothetical protein